MMRLIDAGQCWRHLEFSRLIAAFMLPGSATPFQATSKAVRPAYAPAPCPAAAP
jgi:hypothetical protein